MSQEYRVCEVAQNNGRDGKPTWIIYKEAVYDITQFIKEHPGGEDTILEYAGHDATKAFNEVGHSSDAIKQMKAYKIGNVEKECMQSITSQPTKSAKCLNNRTQPLDNNANLEEKQKKLCFCRC